VAAGWLGGSGRLDAGPLTGWAMIGCGLAGWARRPASRSGPPLAAAGFAWFVPDFAATGADPLGWLGAQALYLHRGPLVQLVLTYPRGRVRGRVEGATVAAGYAAAVVTPVWGSWAGTVALAACLVAGRERRMRRSALQATALFAAGAAAVALVRFAVPGPATAAATLLAYEALLCALAAGVLVGLVRWPWERAEVADLVVELGQARSAPLRDELARALGDPSLQVGYWLLESAAFVDAAGRPLAVPDPGSGRSATMVERDGQLVALLVHDPAVLGDPGLAGAVSSAAGLAAANARLQAEMRASMAEIVASRRRILAAADEERGRLERRPAASAWSRRCVTLPALPAAVAVGPGTPVCRLVGEEILASARGMDGSTTPSCIRSAGRGSHRTPGAGLSRAVSGRRGAEQEGKH